MSRNFTMIISSSVQKNANFNGPLSSFFLIVNDDNVVRFAQDADTSSKLGRWKLRLFAA